MTQDYCFRNLIFEGGGVKGIAYVGALEVLEQKKILSGITRLGGTSAGAITALMLGLDYTLTEIYDTLIGLDFQNFLDDSWGVVRDTNRLIKEYGWYKGDFFREWIGEKVAQKTGNANATFSDVDKNEKFRDLYFVGTNLSTHYAEIFSLETTPQMPIADAVRISMSIPLFFVAKKTQRGDVYVDGGVLDNYPIKLFDRLKFDPAHMRIPDSYKKHNEQLEAAGVHDNHYIYNKETLGFRLDSKNEIAVYRDKQTPVRYPIDDFFDYAKQLVTTLMNVQEQTHVQSDDWQRTVYIDTLGVGTTDFDLALKTKYSLVESGMKGAETYLSWYNDRDHDPAINHPEDKR